MKPRRLWTASFWLTMGAMGACVVAGKGLWLIGCSVSLLALVAIEERRVRRAYPAKGADSRLDIGAVGRILDTGNPDRWPSGNLREW